MGTDAERGGASVAGGASGPALDGAAGIWALVARRADATPDRPVLTDERGRVLTAAGLRSTAEGVAAWLLSQGVGAGTRVMWQLPTSLESVVLSLALARLGAVQNPLIPLLREAEIRALDEQFEPEVAVVPSEWRGFPHADVVGSIVGARARVLVCDHWTAPRDGLALPQGDAATLPGPTAGAEVRWVFTTSGSTARPKGVRHTDASVFAASNATVEQFGVGADDVFPMAYPFAHIGGVGFLLTALRTGCRIVLFDTFDPASTPPAMAVHGATILGSATPFFMAYLAAQRAHGAEPLFDRLRICMGGGAAVAPDLDETVRRELGGHGVANGYGLTEFPIAGFPPLDDAAAKSVSAWRPGPGVEVRIVDADGHPCAPGTDGELRLRGPQRFVGYLEGELDADGLDGDGFVRTGDLAVVDDGGLVRITGRLKEIVVRNGENISVAEVEAVLATHPAIADVAVVGLPDARQGERCCAVLSLAPGAGAPTPADLGEHCRRAGLARFKAPEQVEVVASLPRNAMGKLQRQHIRASVLGDAAS
ncbi:MAG: fadK 2 [Rhizobacter sp.]|nr:fadK 2 [Rhizobacter sp.]